MPKLRSLVRVTVLLGLVPVLALVVVGESYSQTPGGAAAKLLAPAGKPPTAEECQALADEITKAVADRDPTAFERVLDWDAILERSTNGIGLQEDLRKQMIGIMKDAMIKKQSFSTAVIKVVENGGSYKYLRKRSFEKNVSLLFRLLNPESGLNYHDFILGRNASGQVKAVDFYVHLNGERISETLRRSCVQIASTINPGLAARAQGADKQTMDYLLKFGKMAKAQGKGDFQEALAVYDSIPEKFKHEKSIHILRIQASRAKGDEALFANAIEDFRKDFPKDSAINIVSIDYFAVRKKTDNAIACIEILEKAIEGDPYLNVLRAGANLEKGDLQASLKYARSAIAAEPNLLDGYWTLVAVMLRLKDHDTVLKTLRLLRDKHGVEIGDLTMFEDYKDFVKSPQYKQWLKDKPAAGKKSANPTGPRPE